MKRTRNVTTRYSNMRILPIKGLILNPFKGIISKDMNNDNKRHRAVSNIVEESSKVIGEPVDIVMIIEVKPIPSRISRFYLRI